MAGAAAAATGRFDGPRSGGRGGRNAGAGGREAPRGGGSMSHPPRVPGARARRLTRPLWLHLVERDPNVLYAGVRTRARAYACASCLHVRQTSSKKYEQKEQVRPPWRHGSRRPFAVAIARPNRTAGQPASARATLKMQEMHSRGHRFPPVNKHARRDEHK